MKYLIIIYILSIGLLCTVDGFSQSQNPSTSAPVVSPSQIVLGSTITIQYPILNSGTAAIAGDAPINRVTFTLGIGSGIEIDANPLSMLSGNALSVFNVTWDAPSNSFRGVQNASMPANSSFQLVVTGIATTGNYQSNLNLRPNPDNIGNVLSDDESSMEASLPVTLTHFKAASERNTAILNWATAEEVNSDRFEILRSFDTKAWHTIGTVSSNGTSAVPHNYHFTDESPANGNNYYRLKMIDRDGSYEMSLIESLAFDLKDEIVISPNPTIEKIHIKMDNMAGIEKVELRNNAGLLLYNASDASAIDVQRLPAGLYVLSITRTGGRVTSHKVLKQ